MADADEETPAGGGVFRRLAGDTRGGAANAFTAIEELFGPAKREARIEIEQQRRVGKRAPAPGDPPTLVTNDDEDGDAPRFAGTVVIQAPQPRPTGPDLGPDEPVGQDGRA